MRKTGALLMVLAVCAPAALLVHAQSVPTIMNYQGRLTDNTPQNHPVNGFLPMEFRIYGSQVGSDLLWSEAWESVQIIDGIFNVLLGSQGSPIPASLFATDTRRYLEIVVNGETLAPRQRMASSAFAQVADMLDGYDGSDLEESIEIDAKVLLHDEAVGSHPHLLGEIDDLEASQSDFETQLDSHDHDDSYYTQREIDDALGDEVSVKTFGAVGDGVADDTAAVQAAIASLAESGGVVFFPRGQYRVTQPLVLPNDGETQEPRQPPFRFVGEGAHFDKRSLPPLGGSILDLRYTGGPKIATYGLGYLEMHGLTLADLGNSSVPFILTTNTTLHIHDCSFYGSSSDINAGNDAIVLGGTDAGSSVGTSDPNAPFQGYATVIRDNFFARIRRLVYGRVYANGIAFYGNTSWNNCGNGLPGGAAIELDGDPDNVTQQVNGGWYVAGNLIEMPHYTYGIKVRESQRSAYIANSFYDPGPDVAAFYRFEESGGLNYVLANFHDDTVPFVDDQSTGNSRNTIVNFHQNMESSYANPTRFYNKVSIEYGGEVPYGPVVVSPSGTELTYQLVGDNSVLFSYTPDGGSPLNLWRVKDYGGGLISQELQGTDARIRNTHGSLKVHAKVGHPLELGDASGAGVRVLDGELEFASTGIRLLSGNGVPTASVPDGSIYLRLDGGAGSTFYVREAGSWVGK